MLTSLFKIRRYQCNTKCFATQSNELVSHPPSSTRDKKKIVFLGSPQCAAQSLRILYDFYHNKIGDVNDESSLCEIAAVVTQSPTISGKTAVHKLAEEFKIPLFAPNDAKDEEFLANLTTLCPDLCITAAYGNFLPKKFLNIPTYGTLNIHPSLLPKYRGAAPIQRCLENGDSETGVSVVFTVLKMDAGPIVKQTELTLTGSEKSPELLLDLFAEGTRQLIDSLPSVFDGSVHRVEQDHSCCTTAPKITVEEGLLDFSKSSALSVHNKVRAFSGWPGTWSTFKIQALDGSQVEQTLKLVTTHVIPEYIITNNVYKDDHNNVLRLVKYNGLEMFQLVCSDGSVLGISEVHPPSKKVMSARAYVNGLKGGLRGGNIIYWTVPAEPTVKCTVNIGAVTAPIPQ